MGRATAAVLLAATIAAVMFTPIADITAGVTDTQQVTNESWSVDVGNYTNLNGVNVESGSVEVYNSTDDLQTEGTDYDFDYDRGRVKALSGGSLTDGNTATASYNYSETEGTTNTVVALVPLFAALLILGTLAAKLQEMM